jgi:hypothetical protein
MQFQKGQSGNPAGRPRGSFSPTAILAEQMLTSDAQDIIRKTIDKAKDGNGTALRICWDRIAPLPRREPDSCEHAPPEQIHSTIAGSDSRRCEARTRLIFPDNTGKNGKNFRSLG